MSDQAHLKELLPPELYYLKTLAETSGPLVPVDVIVNGHRRTGLALMRPDGTAELVGFIRHPDDKIVLPAPSSEGSPPPSTLN